MLTKTYDTKLAWLQARTLGIGATDASVILDCNPWKSRLRLWAEKTGLIPDELPETEAMRLGRYLEPVVSALYVEETARVVYTPPPFTLYSDPNRPFTFATLDREVVAGPLDNPPLPHRCPTPSLTPGVLELKTTGGFHRDDWQDEPPLMYQIQVQHQLLVTGRKWGSLAVLIGGQAFVWKDIPRHDEFINRLYALEEAFWKAVVDKDQPSPDASEDAKETLHRLFPKAIEDTLLLPPESIEWDEMNRKAKSLIDEGEKGKLLATNLIKSAMKDYHYGLTPNGVRYSWLNQSQEAFTMPARDTRVLRRSQPKGRK